MENALTDPTDWHSTPLASLQLIDAALRCQICKDYYTSAVLTSCSHTFCSLCIRRCLAADGRCPSCNATSSETQLRRNGAVQDIVDAFVAGRASLLDVARRPVEENKPAASSGTRGSKRKREANGDTTANEPPSRTLRTRSQKKAVSHEDDQGASKEDGSAGGPMHIVDSDDDYSPTSTAEKHNEPAPEDGLVACPICHQRMKNEAVYAHLDTCTGEAPGKVPASSSLPSRSVAPPSGTAAQRPERLPQISYALLKDNALRKKLADLRIPTWGSRSLLIRRHSEWLALWNANCDASHPRSRKDLLADLDSWERSQGGRASGNGGDGDAKARVDMKGFTEDWATKHDAGFRDLIKQARERAKKKDGNGTRQPQDDDRGPPAAARPPQLVPEASAPVLERPSLLRPLSYDASALERGCSAPPSTEPQLVTDTQIPVSMAPPETTSAPATAHPLHESSTAVLSPTSDASSTPVPPPTQARRSSLAETKDAPPPPPPASLMWTTSTGSDDTGSRRSSVIGGVNGVSVSARTSLSLGNAGESGVKRKPMFEVPREPVLDSDSAGLR